jgi:hypothetical protein
MANKRTGYQSSDNGQIRRRDRARRTPYRQLSDLEAVKLKERHSGETV